MQDAQAVWLKDKLYVGGGHTAGSPRHHARLYIYSPKQKVKWSQTDTPVYYFALVMYHSKLLLVGGRKYMPDKNESGPVTNAVWELNGSNKCVRGQLPPMGTERCFASAVCFEERLIVVGGENEKKKMNSAEFFEGHHWTTIQQFIPKESSKMRSLVYDGCLYMIGGDGQEKRVYCASITRSGDFVKSPSKLPNVPHEWSSAVVFGEKPMVLGGDIPSNAAIYSFSTNTHSWTYVEDMPQALYSSCTTVQPSGELMVVGGMTKSGHFSNQVFRATLNGTTITVISLKLCILLLVLVFQ